MRSVFFSHLVDGPAGDPALYIRVAHSREAILFDCGSLARLAPREMTKIRYLFVSHTHVDHFVDFDRLVRFFLYTDHQLTVFGPAGIAEQVGNRLAGYTWNLVDGYPFAITVNEWNGSDIDTYRFRARNEFRLEEIDSTRCPDGRLLTTPTYQITATALEHGSITSLAFTLQEVLHIAIHKDALELHGYQTGAWLTTFKETLRSGMNLENNIAVPLSDGALVEKTVAELAGEIAHSEPGMKVCYVTDASPGEQNLQKIEELSRDAHLLAIEAPFAHVDLERAHNRNHLTAQLAGGVARRANVHRCLFFHFSPRYQQTGIDLQTEAQNAFSGEAPSRDATQ